MNHRRAISYPYRNMPKIITMVIILGIALVAFASMIERGEDMRSSSSYSYNSGLTFVDLGLSGLFLSFACSMIWLAGYSLDVIRHASQGFRSLPAVDILGNLGNGLVFWMSRLLWGLVGTILILEFFEPARGKLLVFDFVLFAYYLIIALESLSAAVRCAMLNQASAAFAFPQNLAFLLENKSAFAGLLARLFLLNTAYMIANNAYVQVMTWIDGSLGIDNYLIFIAVFCVGVLLVLIQIMTSLNLIGQFAYSVWTVKDRQHR